MDAATILIAVGLAFSGLFIGACSGLLGIGGGTLMVPLLRIVFSLPAIGATATSLLVIIPTSISGTFTHVSQKTCIPKLSVALGLGGAITSSLGVHLATLSPSWLIMVVAALVILYSATNMLRKAHALPRKAPSNGDGELVSTEQPVTPSGDFALTKKTLLGGFCIGLVAGLLSGYVGVGGGFIMVPLMCSLLKIPIHKATGSSLLAIVILAIPGVAGYCALDVVDYLAALMLTVGSIPGAVLGAKLAPKIPEKNLRILFAGFLGIAAVMLLVKEFGLLG